MRKVVLVVCLGCGGSTKPAEAPNQTPLSGSGGTTDGGASSGTEGDPDDNIYGGGLGNKDGTPVAARPKLPGSTMSIGKPSIDRPGMDPAVVRQSIQPKTREIQECYEWELAAKPGLKGTVTVTFEVGVDGRVTSGTESGMERVGDCIYDVIKHIAFSNATGKSANIALSFTFQPKP